MQSCTFKNNRVEIIFQNRALNREHDADTGCSYFSKQTHFKIIIQPDINYEKYSSTFLWIGDSFPYFITYHRDSREIQRSTFRAAEFVAKLGRVYSINGTPYQLCISASLLRISPLPST